MQELGPKFKNETPMNIFFCDGARAAMLKIPQCLVKQPPVLYANEIAPSIKLAFQGRCI